MEHRTALGNVTHTHLNKKRQSMLPGMLKTGSGKLSGKSGSSRMSLGPGTLAASRRPSLGGNNLKTQSKNKTRHSMAPGAGNRRRKSSVGGALSSHMGRQSNVFSTTSIMLKNDPRPLSNKGYMQSSVRKLIQFLSEHNYDHPISPKVLSRPTGKDFQNVLQFLFLLVDRNLRFGQKFTDEVPVIFKGLCYPFSISKTALSAVGSLHTWPPLLASLTWLMELLECYELETQRELENDQLNGDKYFYTYLREAYQSFLCGDDDRSEELDNDLLGQFEERYLEIEDQTRTLEKNKENLLEELDRIKNSKSSLPALRAQRKDYQGDVQKFQQLIEKLRGHKENLEVKLREREAECNARQQELIETQDTKEKLQKQLDEQELSPADAERIISEREHVTEAQAVVAQDRDEMQKTVWDLEMSVSKKLESIEALTAKYNEVAKRLKLIPRSAQNSQGVDFELRLNISGYNTRGDNLLNVDVTKTLKPALSGLKDFALSRTQEAKTKILELQDTVDKNEEEKATLETAILGIEHKIKECEQKCTEQKEELEKEKAFIGSKMQLESDKLNQLKASDNSFDELESSKFQLRQITKALEDEKLEFDRQEAELDKDIHTVLDQIIEHKQLVEDIVNEVFEKQNETLGITQSITQTEVSRLRDLITMK